MITPESYPVKLQDWDAYNRKVQCLAMKIMLLIDWKTCRCLLLSCGFADAVIYADKIEKVSIVDTRKKRMNEFHAVNQEASVHEEGASMRENLSGGRYGAYMNMYSPSW